MIQTECQVEAFFLQGGKAEIFAVLFKPVEPAKSVVLFIPPFAEEANRCRETAAHQARSFAKSGVACLLIDPYGTGDSQGELIDASWQIWKKDIIAAAEYLENLFQTKVSLWGIRLGALLAADICQDDCQRFNQLILWQPVMDGKIYLNQFLRQRIISLQERNEPAETTKDMFKNLESGQTVEVAGYSLKSTLTNSIKSVNFKQLESLTNVNLYWLEIVANADADIPLINKKIMQDLIERGNKVFFEKMTTPTIWTLQKRTSAPELIDKTLWLMQIDEL